MWQLHVVMLNKNNTIHTYERRSHVWTKSAQALPKSGMKLMTNVIRYMQIVKLWNKLLHLDDNIYALYLIWCGPHYSSSTHNYEHWKMLSMLCFLKGNTLFTLTCISKGPHSLPQMTLLEVDAYPSIKDPLVSMVTRASISCPITKTSILKNLDIDATHNNHNATLNAVKRTPQQAH